MPSRLLHLKPGQTFDGEIRMAVFGTGYWSTMQIPAWQAIGNGGIPKQNGRSALLACVSLGPDCQRRCLHSTCYALCSMNMVEWQLRLTNQD